MKASQRAGINNRRRALEETATALADVLGIDPEYVMIEPTTFRVSVSDKQAARIVEMLSADHRPA